MVLNRKILSKLKDFGLNSYEIKIWAALLSRGVSSAGELSDISNVPRSRAYDVLESLEKKGFIVMKIGKPIKYIAVPPEEVIERVKKDILQGAEGQVQLIDQIKNDEVLEELNLLYSQGVEIVHPTELSSSLKSRDNIYQNLNQLVKSAEQSIVIMTTAKGLKTKAESMRRNLEKAQRRGVSIRIAAPITKENREAAKVLKNFCELKDIRKVKARFAIIDNRHVTFNLLDDQKITPAYDVGIYVQTEFFANSLRSMFDDIWKEHPVAQV